MCCLSQALAGARQVHTFVRDADDAIEWIQEKELLICTVDYGGDLQSVQALLAKHEGYEVGAHHISVTRTCQAGGVFSWN